MNKTNDYFRHRLHDLLMLDKNFRVGLARQLRVPVQTVCDWESGADIPNVYQFREIADCFELPYAWFLDGTDGMPDMTELAEQLGLSEGTIEVLERLPATTPPEVMDAVDDTIFALASVVRCVCRDRR